MITSAVRYLRVPILQFAKRFKFARNHPEPIGEDEGVKEMVGRDAGTFTLSGKVK